MQEVEAIAHIVNPLVETLVVTSQSKQAPITETPGIDKQYSQQLEVSGGA